MKQFLFFSLSVFQFALSGLNVVVGSYGLATATFGFGILFAVLTASAEIAAAHNMR